MGDRTDDQLIVPIDKVNLKKQGKFCRNSSVTGESVSKRTSEIGEVDPPLRLNGVADSRYESTFLESYKTYPTWLIGLPKP